MMPQAFVSHCHCILYTVSGWRRPNAILTYGPERRFSPRLDGHDRWTSDSWWVKIVDGSLRTTDDEEFTNVVDVRWTETSETVDVLEDFTQSRSQYRSLRYRAAYRYICPRGSHTTGNTPAESSTKISKQASPMTKTAGVHDFRFFSPRSRRWPAARTCFRFGHVTRSMPSQLLLCDDINELSVYGIDHLLASSAVIFTIYSDISKKPK